VTVGLSAVNLANAWLNTMRGNGNGTTFTAPSTLFVQWHTGDPGSAGTSNVSTGVATRVALAMNAASAGSQAITSTITSAATGSDTITHISVWSASSNGTFYFSASLTLSRSVVSGDSINLTTLTFAITPIAA
jgi:hypothetical protein